MVRLLFHLFLGWTIVLNGMVYSVICLNFQLNRSIIAAYLCEQKDDPMSLCEGSCYLKKQLNEAEEQSADMIDFRYDFHIFHISETLRIVKPVFESASVERPAYSDQFDPCFSLSIDHPPPIGLLS
jgi:hypothetical protein